jgi:hypothetical protein
MQQLKRPNRIILGLLALGVLAVTALTASPALMANWILPAASSAQAASGAGPFFPDPAWDRKIPAATRFVVLTNWDYAAVLDKETGLVWERAPGPVPQTWSAAKIACLNKTVSNRKGWRLPSIVELTSLADPSVTPGPSLPPGHPFLGIQEGIFWSATADGLTAGIAFYIVFTDGGVGGGSQTDALLVWCVRGGMTADAY